MRHKTQDSAVPEQRETELVSSLRTDLEARLAAYEVDNNPGSDWDSVKARLLTNHPLSAP